MGIEPRKKFSNFHLKEEKTTVENVLRLIGERLLSERNLLYDRYMFHTCNQNEDESFDTYYLRVRKALDVCRYDQNVTASEMLRDRLAFGIKDINLKKSF